MRHLARLQIECPAVPRTDESSCIQRTIRQGGGSIMGAGVIDNRDIAFMVRDAQRFALVQTPSRLPGAGKI